MNIKAFGFFAAAFLGTSPAMAEKPVAAPVEVMVLGAYHFGNPGLDVNNAKVDTVLVPKKQAELDALARALLTFKPTRVMVERQSDAADLSLPSYRVFTPEQLKTEANETEQIGFRIAKMAGHKDVYGIDEQPKDGEPDYFPYDKLLETAAKFGQSGVIDKANLPTAVSLKAFEANQKTQSVAQLLIGFNALNGDYNTQKFYYDVLAVGDNDVQTGADLNAMWYLRNAKIFAKLMRIAKPGDRVLVVYGAGHGFWLRHFARETPGYRFVDPVPYLKAALPKKR